MKDLATQAYFECLQDTIKKHEESSVLKDNLIVLLEERVKIQDTLIADLRQSLAEISASLGMPGLFLRKETKDLVGP